MRKFRKACQASLSVCIITYELFYVNDKKSKKQANEQGKTNKMNIL